MFASGQYSPESREGQHLLAHELTHVAQQEATVGRLHRAPADAPAAATNDNEADLEQELVSAHELVLKAATPEERAWAMRVELLLGWSRPASVADDVVFEAFLSRCYQAADDEARTLAALAPKYTLQSSLVVSAAAFPKSWADRIYKDFHSHEDLDKLKKSYDEQKRAALDVAKTVAPAVWARGLPLTLAQARSLTADDMVWLVLSFKQLAASAREVTDRYAASMAEWLRVAAYYGAVAEYEGDLGVQVRDIREGKQSVSLPLYTANKQQLEQLTLALHTIERAGVRPAIVVGRFMHALVWGVPEDLLIGSDAWPLKGIEAYQAEIAKVDAWIASSETWASIGKAFDWAHERGYFGAAGEEVWASFKQNGWKMAAAVAAILVAQEIPGVNVALDIILLIEFGLDAISTVVELAEAFTAAGSAKSVLEMEHASARIAGTVVGTGAEIVQWLVLWAAGKAANRVANWRDGKKFLEEHGNSPQAREALKKARGDVEKARADMKARQEREAARQRLEEQRKAEAKRKADEAEAKRKAEAERQPLGRKPFKTKEGTVDVVEQGRAIVPTGKVELYPRGKVMPFTEEMASELKSLKNERQTARKEFDKDPGKAARIEKLEQLKHNAERSAEMAKSLEKAGLPDTPAVNDEIIRHLLEIGQRINEGNRVRYPSEMSGSAGKVKLLSTWVILPDGRAFLASINVIPK